MWRCRGGWGLLLMNLTGGLCLSLPLDHDEPVGPVALGLWFVKCGWGRVPWTGPFGRT